MDIKMIDKLRKMMFQPDLRSRLRKEHGRNRTETNPFDLELLRKDIMDANKLVAETLGEPIKSLVYLHIEDGVSLRYSPATFYSPFMLIEINLNDINILFSEVNRILSVSTEVRRLMLCLIIAHEYAHAIQSTFEKEDKDVESRRRKEDTADFFAGAVMAKIFQSVDEKIFTLASKISFLSGVRKSIHTKNILIRILFRIIQEYKRNQSGHNFQSERLNLIRLGYKSGLDPRYIIANGFKDLLK